MDGLMLKRQHSLPFLCLNINQRSVAVIVGKRDEREDLR